METLLPGFVYLMIKSLARRNERLQYLLFAQDLFIWLFYVDNVSELSGLLFDFCVQ